MPGPEALRRREYYGFPGNHFWRIMADFFHEGKPFSSYAQKKALLKKNRIALWDTIERCERLGASDGAIRCAVPNDIGGLIRRYPNIRTIVVNGLFAEKLYRTHWGDRIDRPVVVMPSTSPANAALGYAKKRVAWKPILRLLT